MSVAITREQRDALYQLLLIDLWTFDDMRSALARTDPDLETCYRLGRKVADAMRLIMDAGVGWGDDGDAEVVELKLPDDELRRIFSKVGQSAARSLEAGQPEWEEKRSEREEIILARDACMHVLRHVGVEP